MKKIIAFMLFLLSLTLFGQQLTPEEWDKQAAENTRLLPKYGKLPKTDEEKKADEDFVKTILQKDSSRRHASNHMIDLGFTYMNRGDLKTAMYRFNQAYLLDSTNTDIYWGFGAVYFTLGNYEKAKKQYSEGLAVNPNNAHLLTDYGTYFMAQYYEVSVNEKAAQMCLDSAIVFLKQSYQTDPLDQNTTFKLSVCYWLKGECENAWKYYDACKAAGGQPITEEYTEDLKIKCKRKK